jgi:hypothetical protein
VSNVDGLRRYFKALLGGQLPLALPTGADEQISAAVDRLIDGATCRALGRPPPPVATSRSTDSRANAWMRRIDASFRLPTK